MNNLYIILKNNYPIEVYGEDLDKVLQRIEHLEFDELDDLNAEFSLDINSTKTLSKFEIVDVLEIEDVKIKRCCGCNSPLHYNNKSEDELFCNECVCESLKND